MPSLDPYTRSELQDHYVASILCTGVKHNAGGGLREGGGGGATKALRLHVG